MWMWMNEEWTKHTLSIESDIYRATTNHPEKKTPIGGSTQRKELCGIAFYSVEFSCADIDTVLYPYGMNGWQIVFYSRSLDFAMAKVYYILDHFSEAKKNLVYLKYSSGLWKLWPKNEVPQIVRQRWFELAEHYIFWIIYPFFPTGLVHAIGAYSTRWCLWKGVQEQTISV